MNNFKPTILSIALLGACCDGALAFTFGDGDIKGSLDSTVGIGTGIRASAPGCDTVIGTSMLYGVPSAQPTGSGAPTGCLDDASGYYDQGNLNYKKGDAFTTYIKGTHELLLELPDAYKFMARVNWLRDFTATHASGYLSGSAFFPTTQSFPDAARDDLNFKARLLDLWVSKEFELNGNRARLRAGNQVISWGESTFISGGINQTNAVDIMRLSQPGTQLKEALLPAPIISLASGLGHGFNAEIYSQARWNENYLPPVGSYWSLSNAGKGTPATPAAKDSGQYGMALRYQSTEAQANFGVYYMRYHDKSASLYYANPDPAGAITDAEFLQDRTLYGVSANFPLGNWAIGTELSYRPKDAVTLNMNGANNIDNKLCLYGGKCYVEEKKYQFHLTSTLMLTPGDQGPLLKLLGADSGILIAEAAAVHYPNLKSSYQGVPVAAGQWGWGALTATDSWMTNGFQTFTNDGMPSVGDKTSWGIAMDFNWTYDGTLLPGWQVTPEIFYSRGIKGRTPNLQGTFMEGASSINYVVTFTQNPPNWSVAFNYAQFSGGSSIFDQPYRNRDFYGMSISRSF